MRVVSLLPSATETLALIGGTPLLVGRSHECDHPAGLEHLPVLTAARTLNTDPPGAIDAAVRTALHAGESLYTLDESRLRALRPDVILTQDLCDVCSIDANTVRRIAAAMDPPPRVVTLTPNTFEAVLDDVLTVAQAVGLDRAGAIAVTQLRERAYRACDHVNHFADGPCVGFLEWTDPLFCAGHWTVQLIERAGGRHPLNPTRPLASAGAAVGPIGTTLRVAGKSVRVPPEVFAATKPEYLIIAPCGWDLARIEADLPRLQSQPWWPDLPAVRNNRVALVDGNAMFNRPGPRLVDALEFLVGFLNDLPGMVPGGFGWRRG